MKRHDDPGRRRAKKHERQCGRKRKQGVALAAARICAAVRAVVKAAPFASDDGHVEVCIVDDARIDQFIRQAGDILPAVIRGVQKRN